MRALLNNRPLQAAALAVAFLGLVAYQGILAAEQASRTIGFYIGEEVAGGPGGDTPVGVEVATVEPGRPGAAGGLRSSDVIVEMAGHATRTYDEYDAVASAFPIGQPVELLVLRGGRQVSLRVVPGVPFPWAAFAFDALVTLSFLALAILCLFQSGADLRGRLLFVFLLLVALELALPYDLAADWVWAVYFLLTGLQMSVELHLASVIPEPRPWLVRRPWVAPALYVVGGGFGLVLFVTQLAEGAGVEVLPWRLELLETLLYSVGFPAWALAVPLILVGPATRHPEPSGRQQAALVLAGVLPWTASTLVTTAHELAGATPPLWLTSLEPLILWCYPIAIFVAIYRYQLFDMELVVRRSLVYSTLIGTLLVVFYAALGAGGVFFSEFVESGDEVWVVATATLILGLLFAPLRRAFERIIYSRFFPERVALRQRLTALAGELPALGKLPLMGERLVQRLGTVLEVRWATILVADPTSGLLITLSSTYEDMERQLEHSLLLSPEDPGLELLTRSGRSFPAAQLRTRSPALGQRLDSLRASVASPLISQGELVGLLLLGPKRGGERYSREEMELLDLLSHHVATVFENARLFESATRDNLTGLLRRESILDTLGLELQRARRYDRPLSVGMIDVDRFKELNDRHGHLTGDSALKWVAHLLTTGMRATDQIGRYGGEEFLMVLPETGPEGAYEVADKIRELVAERRLVTEAGDQLSVTVSVGLANFDPESPGEEPTTELARQLIAAADRHLYEAKEGGRNQVRPVAG